MSSALMTFSSFDIRVKLLKMILLVSSMQCSFYAAVRSLSISFK
jgi:hypothetical protein